MSTPSFPTPTIAGINVTPMVDVMLVLLIIFMLVTPLLTGRANFLPARSDSREPALEDAATVVRVDAGGALRLDGQPSTLSAIARTLATRAELGTLRLVVEADRRVPFGPVQGVVETARSAGARSVEIITERAE